MSTISIDVRLSSVSIDLMFPEPLSKSLFTVVYSIRYLVAFDTAPHSKYAEIDPSARLFLLYAVIPDDGAGLVPTSLEKSDQALTAFFELTEQALTVYVDPGSTVY